VRFVAQNVAFTEIDFAAPAVERQPIAFAKGLPSDSRAPALCINGQSRTADQANLPELTRHHRRVGGAASDGGEDPRSDIEAQDVLRGCFRPHQNDWIASIGCSGLSSAGCGKVGSKP